LKICGDTRSSRFATDTGGNGKNLQSENFFDFFWTPLKSRVSIWINFFFKFILRCQQFNNCSHRLPPASLTLVANLPPVSLTLVANLPPVSTTLAKMVEKFAAGVVDTGGKFATCVVDTGGAP
jgi:hypothetical protein